MWELLQRGHLPGADSRLRFLNACNFAAVIFAERHAEMAETMASAMPDSIRKMELEQIAKVCRHVPAHAPRNFLGSHPDVLVCPFGNDYRVENSRKQLHRTDVCVACTGSVSVRGDPRLHSEWQRLLQWRPPLQYQLYPMLWPWNHYGQPVGLKKHVFDNNTIGMRDLLHALQNNFDGQEPLRQRLLNKTPFFGNDDDRADVPMQRVHDSLFKAIDGKPNTKGSDYHLNMLSTTCHIYFGKMLGATPNGRPAGLPISDGTSPSHGADRHGPTAVIKSLSKLDQIKSGGTLLNQRF